MRFGAAAFVLATLRAKAGGAEGIRTPDLLIANQSLYQLSYDPSRFCLSLNNDYNYAVLPPDDKFFAGDKKSAGPAITHVFIAKARRSPLFKCGAPSSHWAKKT